MSLIGKGSTAEHPEAGGELLVPFGDVCAEDPSSFTSGAVSPDSTCLSTLSTFCSSLEPHSVISLCTQTFCSHSGVQSQGPPSSMAQTSDSWDSALASRCSSNPRTTPALSGGATETQRGEMSCPRSHSKAKMRAQLTPLPGHQLSPGHTAPADRRALPLQHRVGEVPRVKGPALASRNKFPLFTEQEGAICRPLMVKSGNDGELPHRSQASSRLVTGHSKYPSPQVYPSNPVLRLFSCVTSGEGRFWSTVPETSNPPS